MINANNIERTVLAPTRAKGQEILSRIQGGGMAWTADMYRVIVFPYVGFTIFVLFFDAMFLGRVVELTLFFAHYRLLIPPSCFSPIVARPKMRRELTDWASFFFPFCLMSRFYLKGIGGGNLRM
jgi:hypothetical protein